MKVALIAVAVLMMASPAFAEDWDFVFANQTGKEIKAIAIAPTGSTQWKPDSAYTDEPGKSAVKAGARTTIHFDKGPTCQYDVKATFADETTATWTGFNACDNAFLTVSLNKGIPTFKTE